MPACKTCCHEQEMLKGRCLNNYERDKYYIQLLIQK